MKKRKGFVSNSSSSSFICDVCGEIESGYDASLSDFDMSECVVGHTFYNNYKVKEFKDLSKDTIVELIVNSQIYPDWEIEDKKEKDADFLKRKSKFLKELTDEKIEEYLEDEDFGDEIKSGYEVPIEMCPICSFEYITNNDAKNYMLKILGYNNDTFKEMIKEKFGSYKDFKEFLTKKE